MTKRIAIVLLLLVGVAVAGSRVTFATAAQTLNGLSRLSATTTHPDGSIDGIATFGGAMPTANQLDALRALGITVQGFQNLPLALLRGPLTAMTRAVDNGIATDVYPNERLRLYSPDSDAA